MFDDLCRLVSASLYVHNLFSYGWEVVAIVAVPKQDEGMAVMILSHKDGKVSITTAQLQETQPHN